MNRMSNMASKALVLAFTLALITPSFAQVAYAKPKATDILSKGLIDQETLCKGVVRFTEYVPIKVSGFPRFAFYTVNVYAVDVGKGVVLIDSGTEDLAQRLYLRVKATFCKKPVIAVLLTHGHADHAGGGALFQKKGATVYVGAGDFEMVQTGNIIAPYDDFRYTGYTPDAMYEYSSLPGGFQYYSTMGHSMGSVALEYRCKNLLFTGDTGLPFMNEDVNKLDFTYELDYGGLVELKNYAPVLLEMQKGSLNLLLSLISGRTTMCPGHKGEYRGQQAVLNVYTAIETIDYILTH